jgi:hypothetical protein
MLCVAATKVWFPPSASGMGVGIDVGIDVDANVDVGIGIGIGIEAGTGTDVRRYCASSFRSSPVTGLSVSSRASSADIHSL